MNKNIILLTSLIFLALLVSTSVASAYSIGTFSLSDSITYNENVKGRDRGFSLARSINVPRLTSQGYYDWHYRPKVAYPDSSAYKISDRLALEAFKTYQGNSNNQYKLRLEKERNRYRYGYGYGGYYPRYSRHYRF